MMWRCNFEVQTRTSSDPWSNMDALWLKLQQQIQRTGILQWFLQMSTRWPTTGQNWASIPSSTNLQIDISLPTMSKKQGKLKQNVCPPYPAGETEDSLEGERLVLLSEVKKRHNNNVVKHLRIQKAGSRQRQAHDREFKMRWLALHCGRGMKYFSNQL